MARHIEVDPGLSEEFHRVVNMSSRELQEWLRMRSAGEDTEALPDQAGTETGRKVLHVLQKRRVDLDEDDDKTMRKVVDRIHAERSDELKSKAGQQNWRHRLMTIGHDPLKETR
jgi:glutamyl-tRNA reductase